MTTSGTATTDTSTYETAVARVEEIVRRLDSGEAGLRETLELVREGRGLVEFCAGELEEVSRGLEELSLDELVLAERAFEPFYATYSTGRRRTVSWPTRKGRSVDTCFRQWRGILDWRVGEALWRHKAGPIFIEGTKHLLRQDMQGLTEDAQLRRPKGGLGYEKNRESGK